MQRRYAVSELNCVLAFSNCWLEFVWFISGLKAPYSDVVTSTNTADGTTLLIFPFQTADSYVKAEESLMPL